MKLQITRDANKDLLLKTIGGEKGKKPSGEMIAAEEMLAASVARISAKLLNEYSFFSQFFRTETFVDGEIPTDKFDLWEDNTEGVIEVWSPFKQGGLASNLLWGSEEYRVFTQRFESAVHLERAWVRASKYGRVEDAIDKMVIEIANKKDFMLAATMVSVLAQVRDANGDTHLTEVVTPGTIGFRDFSKMKTRTARTKKSFYNALVRTGATKFLVSPEIMEQIRSFAFEPANTRGIPNSDESTALGLPDAMRMALFAAGDVIEMGGMTFIQTNALGIGTAINNIFDAAYVPSGDDPTFDGSTQELIIALDPTMNSFVQYIGDYEYGGDSNSRGNIMVEVDDQWHLNRTDDKFGWYAWTQVGALCHDARAIYGIIV